MSVRRPYHPPSRRYPAYRKDNECKPGRFHEYVRFDPPFTSVFCRHCGKHPIRGVQEERDAPIRTEDELGLNRPYPDIGRKTGL
jgi:hypothetical protein